MTGRLRVRMGLHTCEAELRDGDYYGSAVNRAARLMATAHGGQIVLSLATSELAREAPVELLDLGEHRLPDLARPERVFQVVQKDLPIDFPALRSLDAFPSNLPLQLTVFVGREDELAEIAAALDSARVVTLTGIGGVGKTRAALQAAARMLAQYRDGAWFCELAPVGDPDAVVEAVASALGVVAGLGQTIEDSLLDFLRSKQILLVLDNCEHLLDSVTDLVDRVVRACPRVTVLATSREGLALAGERILALRSLGVPDLDASGDAAAAADAVRLFVERAATRAAGSRCKMTTQQRSCRSAADSMAFPSRSSWRQRGCRRCHRRRSQRGSTTSSGLLRGGTRGAVERHQTLRRTIDWSYDLLERRRATRARSAVGLRGLAPSSTTPRRWLRATRSTRSTWSSTSARWSGVRSCSPTRRTAAPATACSKPFVSTRMSTSRTRDRRRQCNVGTRCTTRRSPKKPAPLCGDPSSSRGSNASSPRSGTCVPRRAGRSITASSTSPWRSSSPCASAAPRSVTPRSSGQARSQTNPTSIRARWARRSSPRPRSTPSWAHASSEPPHWRPADTTPRPRWAWTTTSRAFGRPPRSTCSPSAPSSASTGPVAGSSWRAPPATDTKRSWD